MTPPIFKRAPVGEWGVCWDGGLAAIFGSRLQIGLLDTARLIDF